MSASTSAFNSFRCTCAAVSRSWYSVSSRHVSAPRRRAARWRSASASALSASPSCFSIAAMRSPSDPLVRRREIIRAAARSAWPAGAGEVLALLEAQAHPRIQLAKLRVDLRQQRLVVLSAQPDDVLESIEAGLPCHELSSAGPRGRDSSAARSGSREKPSAPSGSTFPAHRAGCAGVMTQSLSCRISSRTSALRNSPFPDAADRRVDSLDLVAERLERAPVHDRGAAVHVQARRRRAARRAWLPGLRHPSARAPPACSTARARGRSASPTPRPSPPAAGPGSRTAHRGGRGRATAPHVRSPPFRTEWCRARGSTCRGSPRSA